MTGRPAGRRRPEYRHTRQRDAIRRAFETAGRPLRPQECRAIARTVVPEIGIATVYRNIRRLVDEGWLRVVELPGAADRYEISGGRHHHHFVCRHCDGVFEVEACPGGFAALAPPGFRVEGHDLVLYGLCRRCGGT